MNTILEKLGLSPNEAKIYLALVENGEASISQISIQANIHRRNAYDAIHRLLNKGLLFQIINPRENHYNAVEPSKLKELLFERETELNQLLPELEKQYRKQDNPEMAFIFRGYEGHKNLWRQMIQESADVYGIGAKAQWFDPVLDTSRDAFYKEMRKKNLTMNLLFDHEVKTQIPNFAKQYPMKLKYKYLPTEYSSSAAVYFFGDYVVMYTGISIKKISDEVVFFLLKSKELAESYRTWFKFMWDKSAPVTAKN